MFCRDRHVFVATKMILVAASASEISVASPFRFVAFLTFLITVISLHKKNMFVGLTFPFCLTDECHRIQITMSSTWNNNNNNSYIVLYPIQNYELASLDFINMTKNHKYCKCTHQHEHDNQWITQENANHATVHRDRALRGICIQRKGNGTYIQRKANDTFEKN